MVVGLADITTPCHLQWIYKKICGQRPIFFKDRLLWNIFTDKLSQVVILRHFGDTALVIFSTIEKVNLKRLLSNVPSTTMTTQVGSIHFSITSLPVGTNAKFHRKNSHLDLLMYAINPLKNTL